MAKLATRGMTEHQDSLFAVDWPATPIQRATATAAPGEWAVIGELPTEIPGLTEPTAYTDLAALRAALDVGADAPKVVLLPYSALTAAPGPRERVDEQLRTELAAALPVLQQWLADERLVSSKLVVLARGAQAVGAAEDIGDLAAAAVRALVRSAQSEQPDRIVQIDLDESGISADQLAAVLATDEPELAIRRGRFHARRIRSGLDGLAAQGALLQGRWRLDIPVSGNPDDITLRERPDSAAPTLSPGAVLVGLRAAGLSFPVALTSLDAPAGKPGRLVHEAAGVVLAVAEDVTGFAPGEAVFGLFDELASETATDHRLLAKKPSSWSFAQAAAAPVSYLTAWHALRQEGAARAGQRVLVHAATGGVGSAAVRIARHLGLDVYATASEPKWEALRGNGFDADRIGDSRSDRFATTFAGARVDLVLNLLPDELTEVSLGLLAPGGRFVEIARSAVREPGRVRSEHGIEYCSFELGELPPDTLASYLAELACLFEAGALAPLPITRFDVRHAASAVRWLSEAEHVGKVVLTWPRPFDPAETVLLTGGTGVIGAIIARHLVRAHGARHLLLTSRSGASAPGVAELVVELAEAGAEVRVVACDAGDRAALAAVLETIDPAHPQGAGVHQAAGQAPAAFDALTPEHQ
ncbi:KR domain-containing protein, partial [Nocardia farcinica]|uniref:KR domain-containing protein n=1 Tax=Nocardia farcinica TaxID=37329 RepID=UPI002457ED16